MCAAAEEAALATAIPPPSSELPHKLAHPPCPLARSPAEDGNGGSLLLTGRMGSYNSVSSAEASGAAAARSASPLDVHTVGAEPVEGASNIPGRPHIYPMPDNPLALLRQLHQLLKVGGGRGGMWQWWAAGLGFSWPCCETCTSCSR